MAKLNVVSPVAISTSYGNTFDIKQSLYNSGINMEENNITLCFYNESLDYELVYFFHSAFLHLDGYYDSKYWNKEKIEEIETNMKKIDDPDFYNKEIPDIDLDKAISYLLDEMDKYNEYLIYDRFVDTVLYNANMENTGYTIKKEWCDLDHLIFIMDNQEYDIRMWNICSCGKVDYTLFKTVGDHGEPIGRGIYII